MPAPRSRKNKYLVAFELYRCEKREKGLKKLKSQRA